MWASWIQSEIKPWRHTILADCIRSWQFSTYETHCRKKVSQQQCGSNCWLKESCTTYKDSRVTFTGNLLLCECGMSWRNTFERLQSRRPNGAEIDEERTEKSWLGWFPEMRNETVKQTKGGNSIDVWTNVNMKIWHQLNSIDPQTKTTSFRPNPEYHHCVGDNNNNNNNNNKKIPLSRTLT